MKAQIRMIIASVIIIALALTAVSGITYSWFSDTEQSKIDVSTAVVDFEPTYTLSTGSNTATSAIGTTLTKGALTDGVQAFTLENLAANQQFTIISNIDNKSTVKTVYRMYATWEKQTDATITNYDIQNISINGKYLTTTEGTSDSPSVIITNWTELAVGTDPTPTNITIATPTTYGDKDDDGNWVLPGSTTGYAAADWDTKTARSGLTINIVIQAYQGDYPYTAMTTETIGSEDVSAAVIPANKVVEASSIVTSDTSSATATNVVMDFSDAGTYKENGTGNAEEITGTKVTAKVTEVDTASSKVTINLNLYKVTESSGSTTQELISSPTFTNPVVITMTVPGAIASPKVVYNGTGEDATVLSSTIDTDSNTTTVVFSVTHFSEYVIKEDKGVVETEYELKKALAAGGNVKLGTDIDLTDTIVVESEVTLDLNGKNITMKTADKIAIKVTGSAGDLTIEGSGQVNGGSGGSNVAVAAVSGGTVTIKGGDYTVGADENQKGNSVIYSYGGNIIIEGGYFHTDTAWNGKYYVLNQYNSVPGSITVTGGSFENYNPGTGDDNLGGNFVADGYAVASYTKDGKTIYEVVPPTVSLTIDEVTTYYEAIDDAVKVLNEGTQSSVAELMFLKDYTATSALKLDITKSVNISGKSKSTITNVAWNVNAPVSVGFSNLKFVTNSDSQNVEHIIYIPSGINATIVVSGCDFVSGCTYSNPSRSLGAICFQSGGASLNVSSSTFALGSGVTVDSKKHALELNSVGSVVLKGNTFTDISRPVNINGVSSVTSSDNVFNIPDTTSTKVLKVYSLNGSISKFEISGDNINWTEASGVNLYDVYINTSVTVTGTFVSDKNVTVEKASGSNAEVYFTVSGTAQIGGSITAESGFVKLGAVTSSIETSVKMTNDPVSGVNDYDVYMTESSGIYTYALVEKTGSDDS